jgi:hypothetical protein
LWEIALILPWRLRLALSKQEARYSVTFTCGWTGAVQQGMMVMQQLYREFPGSTGVIKEMAA